MARSSYTLLTFVGDRGASETNSANRGAHEWKRCILVQDSATYSSRKKGKLGHVKNNFLIGDRAEQPVEKFADALENLGFFTIDTLTINDVVPFFTLSNEFENHFGGIFA